MFLHWAGTAVQRFANLELARIPSAAGTELRVQAKAPIGIGEPFTLQLSAYSMINVPTARLTTMSSGTESFLSVDSDDEGSVVVQRIELRNPGKRRRRRDKKEEEDEDEYKPEESGGGGSSSEEEEEEEAEEEEKSERGVAAAVVEKKRRNIPKTPESGKQKSCHELILFL